jgi:hypothetical protein
MRGLPLHGILSKAKDLIHWPLTRKVASVTTTSNKRFLVPFGMTALNVTDSTLDIERSAFPN